MPKKKKKFLRREKKKRFMFLFGCTILFKMSLTERIYSYNYKVQY